MFPTVLKRIRQRRAVKEELRDEAGDLRKVLDDARREIAEEVSAARLAIYAQLSAPPPCPRCGSAMKIQRVARGRDSGLQKWTCPRYCSVELPLTDFPFAYEEAPKS
jgi:transposase-like protein